MAPFKSLIICIPLLLVGCVEEPPRERRAPAPFVMSDQFTPSGFTGQGAEPEVLKLYFDRCPERAPGARGVCYSFLFRPREDLMEKWVSVQWQSPANNWGRWPPKVIEGGGRKISFKVRGSRPGWIHAIKAGGVTNPDTQLFPYQDTVSFQSVGRPSPTGATHFPFSDKEWKSYTVELPDSFDQDELAILNAFEWVYEPMNPGPDKNAPPNWDPITIHFDDIIWE